VELQRLLLVEQAVRHPLLPELKLSPQLAQQAVLVVLAMLRRAVLAGLVLVAF
jgi:hypothetical protein